MTKRAPATPRPPERSRSRLPTKPAIARKPALPASGLRQHTDDGARKYITTGERNAFLREAERADRQGA